MENLSTVLETATRLQDRWAALPFSRALEAGRLPDLSMVSFLRGLAIVHAVLEGELCRHVDAGMAALARQVPAKSPLLAADLETLAAARLPSVSAALQAAQSLAAEILTDGEDPFCLAGSLYVLEHWQNGGIALQAAIAGCRAQPGERLRYAGCYGSGTAAHWTSFVAALNSLACTDDAAARAVRAAIRCQEGLQALSAACYPFAQANLKHHAADLNCEAGDHAIPQDPAEIALGLRSGQAAWRRYPYLEQRFGERGRRFTGSDSCWIVALARLPAAAAAKNLAWLRTVLASRGIPTVILESHVRATLRSLNEEFPEPTAGRAGFEAFLSDLGSERAALGGSGALQALIAEFEGRLQACTGPTGGCTAELIASAWVDERCGIAGALAAVMGWCAVDGRCSSGRLQEAAALVTALGRLAPPC